MSKKTMLEQIHNEALIQFDRINSALYDERIQCLKDRRFYSIAGAQWEGDFANQYENKPRLEVNKIHMSVKRIISEYRNNRVTVDYVPKDGFENDKIADLCDGMYRAAEDSSNANEAYDNAFEEAVAGGMGAWRLRAVYEDEEVLEDDKQMVVIEPIYEADSCLFFDLNAKRQDKSDAKYCFVLTGFDRQDYLDEWGELPTSMDRQVYQSEFDWTTEDVIYVAEYYKKEEVYETYVIFSYLDGSKEYEKKEELTEERELILKAIGATKKNEKKVKKIQVHKYLISGDRILEDCGLIPGNCIPIVPVYGQRWYIDDIERCMGHVRLAKDLQRVKNMQISKMAEIAALSTVEKPILTPQQIIGHQWMWAEDNIKNYPYLLLNPIQDMNGNESPLPPIGYTKVPNIPPAMGTLLQITDQDMQDVLGANQQQEKIEGNISTETAMLIQNRLDMQSYIYMSNMAKAIKRSGEIWLSMASQVFVEKERHVKTLNLDGKTQWSVLNQPYINLETGRLEEGNQLERAKFDVVAKVGASSSTKRAATVRSLTALLPVTNDPETQNVLTSMILMNMEGEGIEEVRSYFRQKLVQMGVIKPTEQEAQAMMQEAQNTPPNPQEEYLRALAEKERMDAVKKQAEIAKTQAQTDKTRAETAETMTDIDQKAQDQALKAIEQLGVRIQPPQLNL